jgi:hypothetical protein
MHYEKVASQFLMGWIIFKFEYSPIPRFAAFFIGFENFKAVFLVEADAH